MKNLFTKNKGGSLLDLFIIIIILLITLIFFAGITYGWGMISNQLSTIGTINMGNGNSLNITRASEDTIGAVYTGMGLLKYVALSIFIGMVLAMFISNYLIKTNPIFFGLYWIITIIAVIFSAYVSNVYETFLSGNVLTSVLIKYTTLDFIMLHLPYIITAIGFIGGILLFMGMTRDEELGGGIQ